MQAAAQARVAGKDGIHKAAERGDVAAVQDYLILDTSCVNQREGDYFRSTGRRPPLHALLYL